MADVESNKALVRRFFEELWGGRRSAEELWSGRGVALTDYVADNFYQHHPRNHDEDLVSPASLAAWLEELRSAVSDVQVRVELVFGEGDRVMVRLRCEGAPNRGGEGGDAKPAKINWTTTALVRVADGKVAEAWVISDTLGLLQQIGVLAKPG